MPQAQALGTLDGDGLLQEPRAAAPLAGYAQARQRWPGRADGRAVARGSPAMLLLRCSFWEAPPPGPSSRLPVWGRRPGSPRDRCTPAAGGAHRFLVLPSARGSLLVTTVPAPQGAILLSQVVDGASGLSTVADTRRSPTARHHGLSTIQAGVRPPVRRAPGRQQLPRPRGRRRWAPRPRTQDTSAVDRRRLIVGLDAAGIDAAGLRRAGHRRGLASTAPVYDSAARSRRVSDLSLDAASGVPYVAFATTGADRAEACAPPHHRESGNSRPRAPERRAGRTAAVDERVDTCRTSPRRNEHGASPRLEPDTSGSPTTSSRRTSPAAVRRTPCWTSSVPR